MERNFTMTLILRSPKTAKKNVKNGKKMSSKYEKPKIQVLRNNIMKMHAKFL